MALTVLRDRHDPLTLQLTKSCDHDSRTSDIRSHPPNSDDTRGDFAWISANPSEFLDEAGMESCLIGGSINQDMTG